MLIIIKNTIIAIIALAVFIVVCALILVGITLLIDTPPTFDDQNETAFEIGDISSNIVYIQNINDNLETYNEMYNYRVNASILKEPTHSENYKFITKLYDHDDNFLENGYAKIGNKTLDIYLEHGEYGEKEFLVDFYSENLDCKYITMECFNPEGVLIFNETIYYDLNNISSKLVHDLNVEDDDYDIIHVVNNIYYT